MKSCTLLTRSCNDDLANYKRPKKMIFIDSLPIRYEQLGSVVTLTLDRPDTRNALTDIDMVEAFVAACRRINDDSSVHVAIVTGAGTAFSSGSNLKHMRDHSRIFGGDAVTVRNAYPPKHPAPGAHPLRSRGADHRRRQRRGLW